MRKPIFLFLITLSIYTFGQNNIKSLKKLEGIWIAEDFYNSFEKTLSAIDSKDAFHHSFPVALRLNTSELNKKKLNIGYSSLHDHLLRPEVSRYTIYEKDTVYEQGYFEVNFSTKDSAGYVKTSAIYSFTNDWISYIKFNLDDTTISLYRPKNEKNEEQIIKYLRISNSFEKDYHFPNPLYFYTRDKVLKGNYILKDSTGNILSDSFIINSRGTISGYEKFEKFTAYYSTDIYCGPQPIANTIMFYENILDQSAKGFGYAIKREINGNIKLYKTKWTVDKDGRDIPALAELHYELIKQKD